MESEVVVALMLVCLLVLGLVFLFGPYEFYFEEEDD